MRGESQAFAKGGKPELPKGTVPGFVKTIAIVLPVYAIGAAVGYWWMHGGAMMFTQWVMGHVPDGFINVPQHLHGIPTDPHTWGARK